MNIQNQSIKIMESKGTRPWHNIVNEYYIVTLVAVVVYFIGHLWCPATPGNSEHYSMGWFG